jgi:hypothetical protein
VSASGPYHHLFARAEGFQCDPPPCKASPRFLDAPSSQILLLLNFASPQSHQPSSRMSLNYLGHGILLGNNNVISGKNTLHHDVNERLHTEWHEKPTLWFAIHFRSSFLCHASKASRRPFIPRHAAWILVAALCLRNTKCLQRRCKKREGLSVCECV